MKNWHRMTIFQQPKACAVSMASAAAKSDELGWTCPACTLIGRIASETGGQIRLPIPYGSLLIFLEPEWGRCLFDIAVKWCLTLFNFSAPGFFGTPCAVWDPLKRNPLPQRAHCQPHRPTPSSHEECRHGRSLALKKSAGRWACEGNGQGTVVDRTSANPMPGREKHHSSKNKKDRER